jgi:hypothetical protein
MSSSVNEDFIIQFGAGAECGDMNILTIAQADIEPKAKNAPKYKHLP